jgi:hypothetical protein
MTGAEGDLLRQAAQHLMARYEGENPHFIQLARLGDKRFCISSIQNELLEFLDLCTWLLSLADFFRMCKFAVLRRGLFLCILRLLPHATHCQS